MRDGEVSDEPDQLADIIPIEFARGLRVPERQSVCSCGFQLKPNYVRCPHCEGRRNRDQVERLADKIREVKQYPPMNPQDERVVRAQLLALGHPCPDELLKLVLAKQGSKGVRI